MISLAMIHALSPRRTLSIFTVPSLLQKGMLPGGAWLRRQELKRQLTGDNEDYVKAGCGQVRRLLGARKPCRRQAQRGAAPRGPLLNRHAHVLHRDRLEHRLRLQCACGCWQSAGFL